MKLPPGARFPTICIHAGQTPDPGTGAIITPIFQTSTYVQAELGKHKGYEYARTQNPTRAALEANIAAIEGGKAAFAFVPRGRPHVRWVATDQTWTDGTGVEVRGTTADLTLAASGRPARLGALRGPGQLLLATWLEAR